jgi:cell division control protein 7
MLLKKTDSYLVTAVDVWAAGVMFISILSGSYPFFRSPDDMTALAELVTLFGSKTISETAMRLGRDPLS